MREIEFRGKLTNNRGWAYGNLSIKPNNECAIITPDDTVIGKYGKVDIETVGQYIGIKDKNGTKIFEGDIIKREDNILYVIRYIYGGFDSEPINEFYKEPKITWNTLGEMQNALWCMDNCEVIGNIYDNKELLEENK